MSMAISSPSKDKHDHLQFTEKPFHVIGKRYEHAATACIILHINKRTSLGITLKV